MSLSDLLTCWVAGRVPEHGWHKPVVRSVHLGNCQDNLPAGVAGLAKLMGTAGFRKR
jgi:hypothetical protein